MERRYFLASAAAAAATLAGKRLKAAPSDTVRIACVGLRGRGKDHIKGYSAVHRARKGLGNRSMSLEATGG